MKYLLSLALALIVQITFAGEFTASINLSPTVPVDNPISIRSKTFYEEPVTMQIVKNGKVLKSGITIVLATKDEGTLFQTPYLVEMEVPFRIEVVSSSSGDIIDAGKIIKIEEVH